MNPVKVYFILLLLLLSSWSFAGTLAQQETYFFKVSKSLRGIPPSLEERNAFEQAVLAGTTDTFIQSKIQEYLKDEKFSRKLKQKVDELIRVKEQRGFNQPIETTGSSYDRMVGKIVKNNLNWDQLLLSKSYDYRLPTAMDFFTSVSEQTFFSIPNIGLIPPPSFEDILVPSDVAKEIHVEFDINDPRIAGIITTPRFFGRYVNTALNKNRRRAAAIYRIFLCDNMAPSVPARDDKGDAQDFDTIFPGHSSYTEEDIRRNAQGDLHGDLPDCKACHYKLDPLGQVFGYSAATLGPMPAPGALRYRGEDGRDVNIPLSGLGDMGTTLTQQPEYEKCQVRHFWTWYVGKDVPMSRHKEEELIRQFNSVNRRPHDFISYLVSLPEFKEKPLALTEDQLLARRAVRVLKNCNDCHQIQDEDPDMRAWDLTDLPYSQVASEREDAIKLLKKTLDVDRGGLKKKMPPKDSVWKLGQDDFDILKRWIDHGAPDFSGTPQVAPKVIL